VVLILVVATVAALAGIISIVRAGKDFVAALDPIPPSVRVSPAADFPGDWMTTTATDGSFAVTGPGPGTLSDDGAGIYRLDEHDWQGGACAFYLEWVGPQAHPGTYTSERLLDWVGQMRDPHGALMPAAAGSAVGWRTQLSYEDGRYPVGAFQVLYARGWEYSMGCGLPMTHGRQDDARVSRFLDSFEAPASDVTSQP